MIEITLRVAGKKFNVKDFLNRSGWKVICSWERGKVDSVRKKKAKNSGFNLEIYSSNKYSQETYERGISAAIKFLKNNDVYLRKFKRDKALMKCIDVGFIEHKAFSIQARFSGEILKLASKYDIELMVSVYP